MAYSIFPVGNKTEFIRTITVTTLTIVNNPEHSFVLIEIKIIERNKQDQV